MLDGVVDMYLPDLKYSDPAMASAYSRVPDYPRHARLAIAEMYRQVGANWVLAPGGLLRRGLLIRLLVLPNDIAGTRESLEWIAGALCPGVSVSLMAQYYPAHLAAREGRFPLLSRPISAGEWDRALEGLEDTLSGEGCFIQDVRSAPESYRPDFRNAERPFGDEEAE
jgi:putative pyruvate formate lyase activating enzyme